jgi:arylsulfatase
VFDFRCDGGGIGKGGTGVISVAGKQVAQGRIEHTMPVRLSLDETFDLGDTKLTAADVERVRGLGQAARRSID